MDKIERQEAGKRCMTWVPFDLNDWIEYEAGERKWSKSLFIAEALKVIRDMGVDIR